MTPEEKKAEEVDQTLDEMRSLADKALAQSTRMNALLSKLRELVTEFDDDDEGSPA
jgi:methyl-accepting chemotaxis protein